MLKRFSFIVGLAFLTCLPQLASASELTPVMNISQVSVGQTVTVDVSLDSQGETINAVEVGLNFDAAFLDVIDISTGSSFLSLWTERPHESRPGLIVGTGGLPDGTISSGGRVFSVTFLVRQRGSTVISIAPESSGVYRADGSGEPTTLKVRDVRLTVTDPSPFAPRLTSRSHPVEGVWSSNNVFEVAWDVLPETVVSYRLSPDPAALPDDVVEENTGATSYPNLEDGIWYFTFKSRLSGEDWGPVSRRLVWIDRRGPEPFTIDVIQANRLDWIVSFSATDRTSGVDHYLAVIERSRWWKPWSTIYHTSRVSGPFEVKELATIRRIRVIAVDGTGTPTESRWLSPRFVDGSRLLMLVALIGALVLSAILLVLVTHQHTPGLGRVAPNKRLR